MAKSLYGHLGGESDLRLWDEMRKLRRRGADLEAHIMRLQAENDHLVGSVHGGRLLTVDEALRVPQEQREISRSEGGRGGVAISTSGRYRAGSAGGTSDEPPSEQSTASAERIDRLEDAILQQGSALARLAKATEQPLGEVLAGLSGVERAVTHLTARVEQLDQDVSQDEASDTADLEVMSDVLKQRAESQANARWPRRLLACIGMGSLLDLGGRGTSEALLAVYDQTRMHEQASR
jgi:hypothetical protein